jgi:ubiquinone/menaquinone biosynthesis C-methylase UbiE
MSSPRQNLDPYWDKNFAEVLETWGQGNCWDEIQFLMASCKGKVLDIACGTGKVIEILTSMPNIDVYGIDISDYLIKKAIERGIPSDHLRVGDATTLPYPDEYFDYAYSIGSLEHFTEDGILKVISECKRVTKKASFHFIPVSKSGRNEGWIESMQSYFNNNSEWWLDKFGHSFRQIKVLPSKWADDLSVGKWIIVYNG